VLAIYTLHFANAIFRFPAENAIDRLLPVGFPAAGPARHAGDVGVGVAIGTLGRSACRCGRGCIPDGAKGLTLDPVGQASARVGERRGARSCGRGFTPDCAKSDRDGNAPAMPVQQRRSSRVNYYHPAT
jgi:hypothetical protein